MTTPGPQYSAQTPPADSGFKLRPRLNSGDTLFLLVLWCSVCLLFWKALDAGEFWWTDESRHAMNGVFFLDLWQDMPWRAPYEYALQYFAQYPALALNWYPPFFPVVESVFFAVFGINEFGGRLAVLVFTLIGATAWYVWARPIWGREAAILSCLLYLSAPGTLHWTRSVMLEAPAVAMIIVSVWTFDRYLSRPSLSRAGIVGLTLGCMLLLKQTTVFILPALLIYALWTGYGRMLWRKEAVLAYVIVGSVAALLMVHALKFGSVPTSSFVDKFGSNSSVLFSASRWGSFWPALLSACELPLLAAIFIGFVFRLFNKGTKQDVLIFLWIVTSYIFTTIVIGPANVHRYTIYVLPPLALLACMPLSQAAMANRNIRGIAFVLLATLAAWNVYSGSIRPHSYVSGYEQAAEFVTGQENTGLIMFAGKHDGNFIFHLRALDPEKKKAVLRADKILVSMAVHKSFGTVSYVNSVEDVIQLIERFGVGIVVIESRDIVELPEFKLLAEAMKDRRFQMIKEIPIQTNVPEFADLSVQVYRYLEKKEQADDLVIPLPHMGMEIKLNPQRKN
ncbi:glycosyltransferase family 39 protein [Nitrosovibrio sp. Nv6]|uniref:ArnT family glycosyltransferase n=1 Tax=Nitrosovibrio sp. Nv6 TaxID=1855340 RepID=UPI0008C2965A|nr:glycosyltransferase family 39 protein [Nitrosovibrio sp. Nv6]SEP36098.1 Dolichyl-phosphate-mannose-protein mannosyltransferase [Nitrosovibrio sp. Nv6]